MKPATVIAVAGFVTNIYEVINLPIGRTQLLRQSPARFAS